MAKRLKQTLPSSSTGPSDFLMTTSDPREANSRSTNIIEGREPLPKGATTAGKADPEMHYVNYEKTNRLVRVVPDSALRALKQVKISFYSGVDYGWLEATVPEAYPLIPAEHADAPLCVKPLSEDDAKAIAKKRAAHLPKFQKTKPDPKPQKADGKRVFKGRLNEKNVLFDAGDGSTVAVLENGVPIKDGAKANKRELVSQSDATEYAVWVFVQQWKAQR